MSASESSWKPALDATQVFPRSPDGTGTTDAIPALSGGLPASVLGDFRLIEAISQGGMGTVYRAEQISRKRAVAVKVLSKDVARRPGFVARFRREVRAMGRLDDPTVVRYLAAGEVHGFIYLAMELIEGGSLAHWLEKLGRLPVPDAVYVAVECGKALQYAHGQGIVHRDLKPDNVLLTPDGRVKLADLGLAKAADDDDVGLTQTGVGIGTPLYAAPEQTRDAKHADARSDLYSLGAVFYHCLIGRPPFEAADLIDLIRVKERGEFVPASRAAKGVPASLDRVVSRLLARLPDHRFQTAADLLQDLDWLGLVGDGLSFLPANRGG